MVNLRQQWGSVWFVYFQGISLCLQKFKEKNFSVLLKGKEVCFFFEISTILKRKAHACFERKLFPIGNWWGWCVCVCGTRRNSLQKLYFGGGGGVEEEERSYTSTPIIF